MDEIFYYLWLSTIDGIGVSTANRLLARFKSPSVLWDMEREDFTLCGVSDTISRLLLNSKNKVKTNALIKELKEKKIQCVCIDDDKYPKRLKNIYDPPVVLYFKGVFPTEDTLHISVIGARKCSEYGANSAFVISRDLARKEVTIVSGMADGIDSVAHKGAIAGGGKTIAVLGCGVDVCYPAGNRILMQSIINNGCVISEYTPGTKPLKGNFPARNRIISGLCDGLLVIEAGERSGTLITVDFALDHGRDVFALPGNVTSNVSVGTNNLIKQGAVLAENAQDILDEMSYKDTFDGPEATAYDDCVIENLDDDEKSLYNYVDREPVSIEKLAMQTGLSSQTIIYLLTCLEIKGAVKRLPGNRYARD